MVKEQTRTSADIRARLSHPVIDGDGHLIEFTPVLLDYIARVGGREVAERYAAAPVKRQFTLRDEFNSRPTNTPTMWVWPSKNTLDRATASLPRLLRERLDEFGFDYVLLYPSEGFFPGMLDDEEMRRVACRAYNIFAAELYGGYQDRMTPAAVIPMHNPDEAIEELEYAHNTLGMKVAVLRGYVRRQDENPATLRPPGRIDLFGMYSDYDYDPVWAKCRELKIAPTFHSSGMWEPRGAMPNYVYSHIGVLASSGEALCKALLMGGVAKRFPELNFAYLEGGVGWACSLFADLISHWEKRGGKAIDDLDPENLDVELMMSLIAEYGDEPIRAREDDLREMFTRKQPRPSELDDFSAAGIERAEDIPDLFAPRMYFGCEADDPMNTQAFNRKANPFGTALNAVLGSDISHWDVPNMNEVLIEAWEQVEHGLLTEEDFRDFAFANSVRLHGQVNPDFFKGTAIEIEAAKVLG